MTEGGLQSAAGVSEGQILVGKYRIDRILGEGGMGVVVAAHHLQLDEQVAIKFLLPEALGSPEAVARFAREARAAVKIKSEHVARVIDVGTLETGAPYLVMEFLQGRDLAAWLTQSGPLPLDQAVEFVLQACEAVAEAHGLGIVHRDLKPANLFVVRRPDGLHSVKVLDFGISKVTGTSGSGSDMGMTKTTAIMGSPLYMSPEQMASSRNVDARTDIWAFGVILYELLTGTVPFNGESLPEVCFKIATQPPSLLRTHRPDAPPGIEAVILRCLEKDSKRRYANVAELALALVEFGPKRARASAEKISRVIQNAGLASEDLVVPPSSAAPSVASRSASTMPAWGISGLGSTSSRKAFIGVAVALAVVATVPIVLLARKSSEPAAAALGADSSGSAFTTSLAPSADARELEPEPARARKHPALAAEHAAPSLEHAALAPERTEPPLDHTPAAASSHGSLPAAPSASVRPQPSTAVSVSRPPAVPAAAAPTTPPAKPARNCDPPFFFDAAGIKRPKPECL